MSFEFDSIQFDFRQGSKTILKGRWSDFKRVSLVRTEHGGMSIKLYSDGDSVDIPVSKLKIDPFKFRAEVATWMTS